MTANRSAPVSGLRGRTPDSENAGEGVKVTSVNGPVHRSGLRPVSHLNGHGMRAITLSLLFWSSSAMATEQPAIAFHRLE